MAWKAFTAFCRRYAVEIFHHPDYFQNGDTYYFWGCDAIKYQDPKQEERCILLCHRTVDIYKLWFSSRLYHFTLIYLRFMVISLCSNLPWTWRPCVPFLWQSIYSKHSKKTSRIQMLLTEHRKQGNHDCLIAKWIFI